MLIDAKWEGKSSSRDVLQVRLFLFGPEGRRPVNSQLMKPREKQWDSGTQPQELGESSRPASPSSLKLVPSELIQGSVPLALGCRFLRFRRYIPASCETACKRLRSRHDSGYCCCCSATESCLTLCDPTGCHAPGFRVLHHLRGMSGSNSR